MKIIILPILWLSDLAIEIEEQNEKNAKIGLGKIEISKEEVVIKEVAFFGISHIEPHKYEGKDYCRLITLTGESFIVTMTIDETLNKIKYD